MMEMINMKILLSICLLFILAILLLLYPTISFPHEQWFLSAEQINYLNTQPLPDIFTTLNTTNVSILLFTVITIMLWLKLSKSGARELFPNHQMEIRSNANIATVFLRYSTAIMLIMAVYGLNPKAGTSAIIAPTLAFPDLILSQNWLWLKWIELAIAVSLMLGIYVRVSSLLLLSASIFGVYLFGNAMIFYIGFVAGISLYLLFKGAGKWYIPLPVPAPLLNIYQFFEHQPIERAQFLLRVLIGVDLAYTGFVCKFLHPNLAIDLLMTRDMPTFGLEMSTIVFWMAVIETFSGVLLFLGAMVRPIALILFTCFVFLSFAVDEPFISHVIFYGALLTCYINGAGEWQKQTPKDKAAKIIIIGATLAGITSAKKLYQLLGKYSNVQVTLIHNENYFQFDPLLAEIISGTVQPNSIINSIHSVCDFRFVHGKIKLINYETNEVNIILPLGCPQTFNYDQLIIADDRHFDISAFAEIKKTIQLRNVSDALMVRRHIFDCLERAEYIADTKQRKALLTFIIIGGGLTGVSIATESINFITSCLAHFPSLKLQDIKLILTDEQPGILNTFEKKFADSVHKVLIKMQIDVKINSKIILISKNSVLFNTGEIVYSNTIISSVSKYSVSIPFLSRDNNGIILIDDFLRNSQIPNIFFACMSTCIAKQIPYQAMLECRLGNLAAYNAWANSQNFKLHRLKSQSPYFCVACIGKNASTVKFGPVIFHGRSAWIISRYICMLTMPGLERNLRLLIDMFFNIPFKEDIVTYNMNEIDNTDNEVDRLDSTNNEVKSNNDLESKVDS